MKNNFDKAIEFTLKWEGGYVNDPADPGGRTIYGISIKAHPEAWANGTPTKEQSIQIYKDMYWNAVRGDELPDGLDIAVFDAAVNMGISRAVRILQTLVGVPDSQINGVLSDETMKAVARYLINSYGVLRIEFYKKLIIKFPNLKRFEQGWFNRVKDL